MPSKVNVNLFIGYTVPLVVNVNLFIGYLMPLEVNVNLFIVSAMQSWFATSANSSSDSSIANPQKVKKYDNNRVSMLL